MQHDQGTARRTAIGAIGMAAALLAAVGALAWTGGDADQRVLTISERSDPTATSDPTTTAKVAVTAPPKGMQPVGGEDGTIVGYVRDADQQAVMQRGEPSLALGASRVGFRGLVVVDVDGKQVGWFLAGDVGFVSIDEVRDPRRLSEIEATWLRDEADRVAQTEADRAAQSETAAAADS